MTGASKITDEQLKECLSQNMPTREIAAQYNMTHRVVNLRRAKLAKKGLGHGRDVSHVVPDGYRVKGTSALTDAMG